MPAGPHNDEYPSFEGFAPLHPIMTRCFSSSRPVPVVTTACVASLLSIDMANADRCGQVVQRFGGRLPKPLRQRGAHRHDGTSWVSLLVCRGPSMVAQLI